MYFTQLRCNTFYVDVCHNIHTVYFNHSITIIYSILTCHNTHTMYEIITIKSSKIENHKVHSKA